MGSACRVLENSCGGRGALRGPEDVFTYMYTIYETCGEDKQPIALKLAEIKEVQFKSQQTLNLQTIDMSKEKNRCSKKRSV